MSVSKIHRGIPVTRQRQASIEVRTKRTKIVIATVPPSNVMGLSTSRPPLRTPAVEDGSARTISARPATGPREWIKRCRPE